MAARPISRGAVEFVRAAIDVLATTVHHENDVPIPEILVENAHGTRTRTLVRATSDPNAPVSEADVAQGRSLLQDLSSDPDLPLAVLVYGGYVTKDGARMSALLAEIVEGGVRHLIAQPHTCCDAQFVPEGRLLYISGSPIDSAD